MSFQNDLSDVVGAISSGTFDPQGINSTTFKFGTGSGDIVPNFVPAQNSASSPSFGLSGSSLPAIGGPQAGTSSAAASSGISGAGTPPASTTGSTSGATIANSWFVRAVIVILGFIFVAVGLSQFGVVQRFNPLK
jgi:hypothetical protein